MGSSSEELLLKIAGDSSGGQDAVRALTEALTGLSGQLSQSGATANTAGGHVAALGTHSDNATLSVYQLRSSLRETFEGNFEGAIKNLAASIGADLEGGISLASTGMMAAAGAAATLAGAFGFLAERAIAAGEANADFAYKTSIAMDAVEPLREAVTIAGGSLDQFGNLVFRMQQRMAESPDQFEKGLDRIHLSLQDITGLSPDQQFLKIADAFRTNTDESNRAATAVELFSRAGRDAIPLMMKPLGDLTDQMKAAGHVMSDEDTKAAEELGIAWRGLKEDIGWMVTDAGIGVLNFFKSLATGVNEVMYLIDPFAEDLAIIGARIQGATPKVQDLTAALSSQTLTTTSAWDAQKELDEEYGTASAQLSKLREEEGKHKAAVDAIVAALEGETKKSGETAEAIRIVIASHTENADVIMRTVGAIDKLYDSGVHVTDAMLGWADANRVVKGTLDALHGPLTELSLPIAENTSHVAEMRAEFALLRGEGDTLFTTTIPEATGSLTDFSAANADAEQHLKDLLVQMRNAPDDIGLFDQAIEGIPKVLERVFASGGSFDNVVKALGSKVGENLGKSIQETMYEQMSSSDTGDSALTSAFGDTIGGALTAALPAIGALVGPLVSKLFSMFGPSAQELEGRKVEAAFEQQFGSFQKMMDAVGAAYAATGRSSQQAQADVLALMHAEVQGGQAATDAANKIKEAFTDQTQDAADLTAAVQRYGFTLAELGPTMQKQQLDQQAQQLLNDWRLLVASGIDVVNVDARMASSIQDYLTKARQTGQEVPSAMKPILQSLIDQGKLTDDNGVAITDMKDLGVTFSETMTEGFQKVVDKLQQLLEKIGMVPAAIAAIPKTFDVTGTVHYDDPGFRQDQYAARGGFVTAHGIAQYLDAGGFPGGPSGTDTIPAWLTPGEGVLNVDAMSRLGRSGLARLNRGTDFSKLSPPTGVVIHAPVTVEGNVLTERDLFDAMGQHFADVYSQTGGALPLNR